jgi:glycine betaine/choline ABC-type transport system substrate-binding protein
MDRAKIIACIAALLAAGCSRSPRIVVASKNFTEQLILGEMLAQQIERKLGVRVERKLNIGGTMLAHQALVKGDIDLYPEYTGTALTAVLKLPPVNDRAGALEQVRVAYRRDWRLEWLPPLGFNNTFALIVRGDEARKAKLNTLSQAASKRAWRLGVGYEFQQRPDGLDGLMRTYSLRLEGQPVTMDLGLLYAALDGRKVDLIAANSTDGLASAMDVTILEDDRHYFPPYECAVIVRSETLERFPELRGAIEELSGRLPDTVMRRLNNEVDGKKRPIAEVAGEFLLSY